MSRILKNNTASPVFVTDTGITVPASGSYTLPPQDYLIWGASSDVVVYIGNSTFTVNDGLNDLSISDGMDLIKGFFPNPVGILGQHDDVAMVSGAEDSYQVPRITPYRAWHTNLRDSIGNEVGISGNPFSTSLMGQHDDVNMVTGAEDSFQPTRITPFRAFHTNLRDNSGVEFGVSGNPIYSGAMGHHDDIGSTISGVEDTLQVARITPFRAWHVNSRDSSGSEFGVSANPFNTRIMAQVDDVNTVTGSEDSFQFPRVTPSRAWHTNLRDNAGNVFAVSGNPLFAGEMGQVDDVATVTGAEDSYQVTRITPYRAWHTNLRDNSGSEFGVSGNPFSVRFYAQRDDVATVTGAEDSFQIPRITQYRALHSNLRDSLGNEFGVSGNPLFSGIMGQHDDVNMVTGAEDSYQVARITPFRAVHTNLRDNLGNEVGVSGNPFSASFYGQRDDVATVTGAEDSFQVGRITPLRAFHVNLRDNSGNEFGPSGNPLYSGAMGQHDDVAMVTGAEDSLQVARITPFRAWHANPRDNSGVEFGVSANPFTANIMGQHDDAGSTVSGAEDTFQVARITPFRALHANLRDNSGSEFGVSGNPLFSGIMGQHDDVNMVTGAEDSFQVARITPFRALHSNLRDNSGSEFGVSANPFTANVMGQHDDIGATVSGAEDTFQVARITPFRGWHTNLRDNSGAEFAVSGNPLYAGVMGQHDDVGATVSGAEDTLQVARITPFRAWHTNLRDSSGNEIGVSGSPFNSILVGQHDDSGPTVSGAEDTFQSGRITPFRAFHTNIRDNSGSEFGVSANPFTSNVMGQHDDVGATVSGAEDTFQVARITPFRAWHSNLRDNAGSEFGVSGNPFHARVFGQRDDVATVSGAEDSYLVPRLTPARAWHTNLRDNAGNEIGTTSNPISTQLADFVSTANSTTTPLAANATFTGSQWEDLTSSGISTVAVTVFSSHDSAVSGVKFQFSTDGSNVDVEEAYSFTGSAVAGMGEIYTFGKEARYFRMVYVNGATLQTAFRLQTIYSRVPIKYSSHRVEDILPNGEFDSELVKSIQMGRTPSGTYRNLNVDETGNAIVNAIAGFNAAFTVGFVATAASVKSAIRATTFVEQSTNATRSISSASANDTSAGTGARTLKITYYTATFTGPFTTTVTMNGASAVNTSVSDICYVEKIEVVTAGSGGVNAGVITLFAAAAAAGGAIGTIALGDNQTFWTHHYVPTGKTAVITGFIGSHSNTVVGGGGMFILTAKDLSLANSVERQISDFLRVYGQASSSPRNYGSPIKVIGPARILAYVTPETSTASVYRAAFDFFEQTT